MSPRSRELPPPHFARPELPVCVGWRPRRRWPLGVTVQTQALVHLRELLAWRQAVWEDEDPEAVHQLRVHTRRLRSTLQTFAGLWAPEDARRWIRELGRFARAFGDARDLDVHLEDSEDWPDEDPAAARAATWLRSRWRSRRDDLRDDLRRALVRFEQAWTPQRLMEFLSTTPLDLWRWSAEHRPSGKRRKPGRTPPADGGGGTPDPPPADADEPGPTSAAEGPDQDGGASGPVVHGGVLFEDPGQVPPAEDDDEGQHDDAVGDARGAGAADGPPAPLLEPRPGRRAPRG